MREGGEVRWRDLFDDLEAQLDAASAAELAGEVAERSRLEQGRVTAAERLALAGGAELAVTVPGHGGVRGVVVDAGADWLLLAETGGREVLVPLAAVLSVAGLPRATGVAPGPDGAGRVARSLDLRRALRGLARDRAGVQLGLCDGSALSGTLDRVGADHVELAEHLAGEARRPSAVRAVRLVPLSALSLVRRG
jgi:hypothetical protein